MTKSEYEKTTSSRDSDAIGVKLSVNSPLIAEEARSATKTVKINNGPGLKERLPTPLQKFLPEPKPYL